MISFAQPANDEPCGAIDIPVTKGDILGTPCTPTIQYSWTNASLTPAIANPSCLTSGFSNMRDVWYKMTVPASGKIEVSIFSPLLGHILTAYAPAACGSTLSFVEISCLQYYGLNQIKQMNISSLTPGAVIYLRIMRSTEAANNSGNPAICAIEPASLPTINNSQKVGIGSGNPQAKLDIAGTTIIRDSLLVAGSIETRTKLKATSLQITSGAGEGKRLVADAEGNASWVLIVDSVYSSPWMVASSYTSDSSIDGSCVKVRYITAPELTLEVLNKKLMTVYMRVGSIGPYQLPYIGDAGGATNQITGIFNSGRIIVYRHTFNTCRYNSGIAAAFTGQPVMITLPSLLEYRYVIHR